MKDSDKTLLNQLKRPFPDAAIKWRIGQVSKDGQKAMALAYIESREVYRRLDDVCGIAGWQTHLHEIKGGFTCELSIKMPDGEWITKSDSADYTDMEAIKGGASSAVKRAAAVWGVGRYLYYLPSVWVKTKVLYTKKNGDPAYGLAEKPTIPNMFTVDFYDNQNGIERWEDVLEMEKIHEKELEDDTKSTEEKKAELKEKLNEDN